MTEADIIHQAGPFWVGRTRSPPSFTVYQVKATASHPDSSYAPDDDGRSMAVARCNYMARRAA
jgi:hypothetical protein